MQMDTTDPEKKSSLDAAWGDLQRCFGLRGCRVSAEQVSPSTAAALAKYGIAERTARHIQAEVVEKRLREDVAPSFWAHFANADRLDSEEARCHRFVKAVSYLHASYVNMKQVVTKMAGLGVECTAYGETSYPGLFHLTLKGTLHSQMPPDFETLVEAFYSRSFHVFCARQEEEQAKKERATKLDDSANSAEDEMDDSTVGAMECPGCRSERESCICPTLLSQFDDVNAMLLQMDLLERLTSHCLTRIVHARIDRHVQDTCKGSFTISHLDSLEEWLDAVVVRFMRLLYSSLAGVGMDDCLLPGVLQSFRRRLCNHLYETYTRTRIDQLFNVIIEFPESAPALEDVRECLEKTDLRQYLTANLKAVLQRKLLHLGVSTTDILTAYISAIKSLR
jgi:anaphase-promoting complex subunit 2